MQDLTEAGPQVLAVALIDVATVGKLGAWKNPAERLAIGLGMLARGEVGLIFAGLGATTGILTAPLYASLVLTIAVTTLVAPPCLKRELARVRRGASACDSPTKILHYVKIVVRQRACRHDAPDPEGVTDRVFFKPARPRAVRYRYLVRSIGRCRPGDRRRRAMHRAV